MEGDHSLDEQYPQSTDSLENHIEFFIYIYYIEIRNITWMRKKPVGYPQRVRVKNHS